jgi:hypothetical protein
MAVLRVILTLDDVQILSMCGERAFGSHVCGSSGPISKEIAGEP